MSPGTYAAGRSWRRSSTRGVCAIGASEHGGGHTGDTDRRWTTEGGWLRSVRQVTEPTGGEVRRRTGAVLAPAGCIVERIGGRSQDLGSIARRLRKEIFELYGWPCCRASGFTRAPALRVARQALARQTDCPTLSRYRVCRQVVGGSIGDAEAAWRGAFLARTRVAD